MSRLTDIVLVDYNPKYLINYTKVRASALKIWNVYKSAAADFVTIFCWLFLGSKRVLEPVMTTIQIDFIR